MRIVLKEGKWCQRLWVLLRGSFREKPQSILFPCVRFSHLDMVKRTRVISSNICNYLLVYYGTRVETLPDSRIDSVLQNQNTKPLVSVNYLWPCSLGLAFILPGTNRLHALYSKTEFQLRLLSQEAVTDPQPNAATPEVCNLWMEDLSRPRPELILCKYIYTAMLEKYLISGQMERFWILEPQRFIWVTTLSGAVTQFQAYVWVSSLILS
jgi:hypothetical protein